jgi:hypothetical protein
MRPPQPQPQPRVTQASPKAQPQVQGIPPSGAAQVAEKPAPAKKGRPLLKWGIVALLVSGLLFGLWSLLSGSSLLNFVTSLSSDSGKPLDPDDPRSQKADRLPSPNGL